MSKPISKLSGMSHHLSPSIVTKIDGIRPDSKETGGILSS